MCHDLCFLKHRSLLADLEIMLQTPAIATKDTDRPLRVPESQFVFGRELGIDTSVDEAGGSPELDQVDPPTREPSPATARKARAAATQVVGRRPSSAYSLATALRGLKGLRDEAG